MKEKKIEFVGYTVKDWKDKFYHNKKHMRLDVKSDIEREIPFNVVICDVCNKEIRQPKDKPDEKVIWDWSGGSKEGNWALCTDCKNSPKDFDRSKKLMDEYKKITNYPEKKLDAMKGFVDKSLLDGLRKGWYKFKDDNITIEKWMTLSDDEKENYPIGLTELGKKEGGNTNTDNLLKLIQDRDVFDSIFRNFDMDDEGNVKIELTQAGQQIRQLYELSGLDFSEFMQKKLKSGIKTMFSEFIIVDKKNPQLIGQMRLGSK